MDNQGFSGSENNGAERKAKEAADQPRMNRQVLPPINIAPQGPRIQQSTNPALMSGQPPYPVQPAMGYVPPTATYTVPSTGVQQYNPRPNYKNGQRPGWAHKCAMILSVIMIISGIIIFIMNIAALVTGVKFAVGGAGIWGGLFMIITGGIGVCASKIKSTCTIVTLMVLTIILSVLCVNIFGAHTAGTIVASIGDPYYMDKYPEFISDDLDYDPTPMREYIFDYNCTHPYETVNDIYCDGEIAYRNVYPPVAIKTPSSRAYRDLDDDHHSPGQAWRISFNAILTAISLIVGIICIVASALTCRAVCCRSNSNIVQVVYVPSAEACHSNQGQQGQGYVSQPISNMNVISVAPHGQFQHQYVQNQGTASFSPQTGAMASNTDNQQQEEKQPAPGGERSGGSPPPPYRQ